MKNPMIATEAFSSGRKSFFLDFMLAKNNSNYMRITSTCKLEDGSIKRARLYIWQEDFELWIAAFASLFQSAAYAQENEVTVQDLFNQNKQKDATTLLSGENMMPREKFVNSGADALSSAELLAMLIGSGNAENNALELGEKVLEAIGHDLRKLSGIGHAHLSKIKGVGFAKTSAILSAVELGKRVFARQG